MFRSIMDVVRYFNGTWARQNTLMDFYSEQATAIGNKMIKEHPEMASDIHKFSSYVTACSALSGARLGSEATEEYIDNHIDF